MTLRAFCSTGARARQQVRWLPLAAITVDAEMLGRLDEALAAMAADNSGHAERLQADRHFHMLIAEAAGNSLVATIIETLWKVRE